MKKVRNLLFFSILISILLLSGCSDTSRELANLQSKNRELHKELKELQSICDSLKFNYKELEKENDEYKSIIEPYKTLKEAQVKLKAIEAQNELDKAIAEEEKKEAEVLAAKQAEDALGYDTGITFEQLVRYPDDCNRKKVKFTGEVVQIVEEKGSNVNLRIAIDNDLEQIVMISYNDSLVDKRILEEDIITFYGVFYGIISYESVTSDIVRLPYIILDKIDQE